MVIKKVKPLKISKVMNSVLDLENIPELWEVKNVTVIQRVKDEKYILIFQKHKLVALDSFEEPSWHTTTVSAFPDSGFSSGETQLQDARLCEPQTPLPVQGAD